VLHLLGAPHEPPEITEHHYNLLYGDLEKPPDFTRDDTTGEYRDAHMQAVYEAGVKSELVQAIGRAGLVKNPSTVVLRTSLELSSVSHRDQTHHFDETDWMNADGNLDTLPGIIEAREAAEAAEADAFEDGDIQGDTTERFRSMHEAGILDRHEIAERLNLSPVEAAEMENEWRAEEYTSRLYTGYLRTGTNVLPRKHFISPSAYQTPMV